jgi:hypothetical protein
VSHFSRALKSGVIALVIGGLVAPSALAIVPGGVPASVVVISPPSHTAMYSGVDYGKRADDPKDDHYSRTTWKIVEDVGNCCEDYLTVSSQGRLFDFGGTYINYTDDRGGSWKQVQPLTPLVNGEGAIVVGVNGDIDAVGWDPYSGDHLQSFKYDAARTQWLWSEMPLHTPFYDREWIGVVPGPITKDDSTYPYVSFVRGGYPYKDAVWEYSTDGTTYTDITSYAIADLTDGSSTQSPLPTVANARNDWIQPNSNSGFTPLGGNKMLANVNAGTVSGWALFDGSTFSFSAYKFPDGSTPQGRFQVDSAGRIHNVIPSASGSSFVYRISTDGGRTWRSTSASLPQYMRFEQWDFRANKAAGLGAVAIDASNLSTGSDQELVYKFDISTDQPSLKRMYKVGQGDQGSTAGVGNDVRLDFETVAIFADGRVATTVLDTTTNEQPALAIEQNTTLGGKVAYSTAPAPVMGTLYASYSFDATDEGWVSSIPGWLRGSPGAAADGTDSASGASWGIDGPTGYIDSLDATLTSPLITTLAGYAVVDFMLKGQLEEGFDYASAEWSSNGGVSWLPLTSFTGTSVGYPNWQKVTAGFSSPGGPIQVRFHFTSDQLCSALDSVLCGSPATGVRIDSVRVGQQQ